METVYRQPSRTSHPHDRFEADLPREVPSEAPFERGCVQWPSRTEQWEVMDATTTEPTYARYGGDVDVLRVDDEQVDGYLLAAAFQSETFVEIVGWIQLLRFGR